MQVLILNQAFHPDVVSTAQHASDLAEALAASGDRVTVIAGRRGYDDPTLRFPPQEDWQGVRILRVATTGFGKGARWRRAADFASFILVCCWKLLWLPRQDVVIALTSPPLISFIAAWLVPWKATRLVFWCMDLNPDEAIAAGWLRRTSLTARMLSSMLRFSLRRATNIVALDRFMAERIRAKGIAAQKITVLPPWSHDDHVRFSACARDTFREQHGFHGKFVVMHSGNHSPCHPLTTLLEAAAQLQVADSCVCFCFAGGGSELARVKQFAAEHALTNVVFLPYQPRERLAASLSAADMHAIVMGNDFVGIVHPCKGYNVLAVGSPVLYIGPPQSHVADLMDEAGSEVRAYSCRHADAAAVVSAIRQEQAHAARNDARRAPCIAKQFSKRALVPEFIKLVHGKRLGVMATATTPDALAATGTE